ncbi:MAG: hypothetical protein HFH93_07225, partial [Lachnospiraceae bacterium]|nr:hypothetical protein [Lachnospiraceae bacterium]
MNGNRFGKKVSDLEQKGDGENLKDLEMAKKRDHKIMITDEAIKKVPRIA